MPIEKAVLMAFRCHMAENIYISLVLLEETIGYSLCEVLILLLHLFDWVPWGPEDLETSCSRTNEMRSASAH